MFLLVKIYHGGLCCPYVVHALPLELGIRTEPRSVVWLFELGIWTHPRFVVGPLKLGTRTHVFDGKIVLRSW